MLGHSVWFKVLEAEPLEGIFSEETELVINGLIPRSNNHEKLEDFQLYWSKKSLYKAKFSHTRLSSL